MHAITMPGECTLHLEVAITVQQKIGGLKIPMNDICRMNGFESTKGLVDKILGMIIGEVLCPDDAVHVCFHEFLNH